MVLSLLVPFLSPFQIWQTRLPNSDSFPMDDFLHIGFSHHTLILSKIKDYNERLFYIKRAVSEQLSFEALKQSIVADDYHHQAACRTTLCGPFLPGSKR